MSTKNTRKDYKSLRKLDEDSYVDPYTGKIYSSVNTQFFTGKIRPKIKENFMLGFQQEFTDLAQRRMSGMDYAVLLFLIGNVDYEGKISISQGEIAQMLNCQQQMVSRSIGHLKEGGILKVLSKKGYQSVYFINPYLCVRGDASVRKETVNFWERIR